LDCLKVLDFCRLLYKNHKNVLGFVQGYHDQEWCR
jgi:hypothetical protein